MKILIACEFSGTVRDAFSARGHDVTSCDILASEKPGKHYQGSVLDIIEDGWDMMIAHPPCTYLTTTGNRWFKPEYREKFPRRKEQRAEAIDFFIRLANAPIEKICIENPVGIMNRVWRKPDQIIQPFQFGHPHAKRTCLWLKGLPRLVPTKEVAPDYVTYYNGKRMSTWYANAPVKERAAIRSKTFQGIADAMAEQWG